jgi:hypothetical protein
MNNSDKITETPTGVECRMNLDGNENPKYVDVLEEDKPIAGQKFVCVSFLSPEKILKQKEAYMFAQFLKQWDMNKSLEKFNQFLNFVSYKYSLNFDNITKDLTEFCDSEKNNLFNTTLEDEYKSYIDNNEEKLTETFNAKFNFQTNVRGLKVRGSYPSQQEAELRCKMLREIDPNHDVYVGPVGLWMPFHPEAYKTGKVEYMEDELNQLMHEKKNNEEKAKNEFEKRVHEAKVKAMEDNKKKAAESGNVLTQTINADGDLVNIKNVDNIEDMLDDNATAADIRRELFEGDNVVTDHTTSDHGLSSLIETQAVSDVIEISETSDEKLDGWRGMVKDE